MFFTNYWFFIGNTAPQKSSAGSDKDATRAARVRDIGGACEMTSAPGSGPEILHISVPTVCSHIRRIYEKPHVQSRSQAVSRYRKQAGSPVG